MNKLTLQEKVWDFYRMACVAPTQPVYSFLNDYPIRGQGGGYFIIIFIIIILVKVSKKGWEKCLEVILG